MPFVCSLVSSIQPEFPIWTSISRIICFSCPRHNEFASRLLVLHSLMVLASAWLFASKAALHGGWEHAAAARLPKQLPGGDVAYPRSVEQIDGNVDAEAGEIGRARFFSKLGISTASTVVEKEDASILKQTHPARQPSTPAANIK
jgi:hypothetical protein